MCIASEHVILLRCNIYIRVRDLRGLLYFCAVVLLIVSISFVGLAVCLIII